MRICQRPLESNPLSEETTNILRSWLHQCHDFHTLCNPTGASGRLPTRLLDVGGSTFNEEPRLIVSADDLTLRTAIDTPYVALSHCWGKDSAPLKTETFSLAHRLNRIPMHSIPSTYRDAILLTRSLRIRYLWIDSLCIIQDDIKDWERESATMFDIYRNAHVTLCALVNSCNDGFLPQGRRNAEITFRSSVNSHVYGSLSLREISPRSVEYQWYNQPDGWQDHYAQSEWKKRAWTYQEQKFSPKKLICGLEKFHYDCDTMTCSENGLILRVTHASSIMRDFSVHDWTHFISVYDLWYMNLRQYAERSLSFPQDRFPAISSLAAMIAERTKDRFIAGLWEEDLPRGLYWQTSSRFALPPCGLSELIQRLTNPEVFIAPSWSWACLQTYKEWGISATYVPQCQISEVYTQVDGGNPFGRVVKAHLTILGKLLHVYDFALHELGPSLGYTVTSSGSFMAKWKLDWVLTDEELTHGFSSEGSALVEVFMLLLCSCPREVVTTEGFGKWCKEWWRVPGEGRVGLVLCSTATKDEYLRIGTFETVDWEKGGRKLFESIPEREIKLV